MATKCATATSPIVLVAARLMQGMGSCAGQVVSRSVVRDKFDQTETARMFSMMAMITGLVPLIAPAVGWLGALDAAGIDRDVTALHLHDTRGTGIMNRLFDQYGPYKGQIEGRQCGVLISNGSGEAVAYALNMLEERGSLFVRPQDKIYEGMIIGENAKPDDLEVNPMKSKQLTNFRSTGNHYKELEQIAPYAVNAQIKVEIYPNGNKEETDLKRVMNMLRATGYSGWVGLEYEAKEDPLTAIPIWLKKPGWRTRLMRT